MSERLRPWKRPPKSSRFVSNAMIERARLSPFQAAMIEEMLLEQEVKRTRHDIDFLNSKITALQTAEGIEAEKRTLELERTLVVSALEELQTEDGVRRAAASCERMMEQYELQNLEREKILETLRNRREDGHV